MMPGGYGGFGFGNFGCFGQQLWQMPQVQQLQTAQFQAAALQASSLPSAGVPTSAAVSKAVGTPPAKRQAVPEPATGPRSGGRASAFALVGQADGSVSSFRNEDVTESLERDWSLFKRLASAKEETASGLMSSVVMGAAAVRNANAQGSISIVFVPHSAGEEGEAIAKEVSNYNCSKSYIVGMTHDLYKEINDWGTVGVLRPFGLAPFEPSSSSKRPRTDPGPQGGSLDVAEVLNAAKPKAGPPGRPCSFEPKPEDHEKDLRRAVKELGSSKSLEDKQSVPKLASEIRDRFLKQIAPEKVFKALAQVFQLAKGIAHRKAIVYVAHELLTRQKGQALAEEDRRPSLLRHLLLPIGKFVRSFKAEERTSYCRLVEDWTRRKALPPGDLSLLKDAWDVD